MCQMGELAKILEPLFVRETMIKSRQMAVRKFEFFTHVTPFSCIESIRNSELRAFNPTTEGLSTEFPTNLVGNKILCLTPYPRNKTVHLGKEYPHIKLGILPNDLPEGIIPDWSYETFLEEILKAYNGGSSIEEAFMEVARDLGSIGCLSGIKVDKLRVCVAEDAWCNSPETWPLLSEVPNEDIFKYEPRNSDDPDWLNGLISSY